MKVILKEDVQNLGQQGDVVEVKSGYARNYLMPQKLAILFTRQQKKSLDEAQRVEERKLEREKDQLESVLKQVEDLSLSLKMQSEEDSKLFGSVTKLDIIKLLEENGITIDKKYVDLSSPIKTLGEHKVNIMFTKEMSASFTLTVEKEVQDVYRYIYGCSTDQNCKHQESEYKDMVIFCNKCNSQKKIIKSVRA